MIIQNQLRFTVAKYKAVFLPKACIRICRMTTSALQEPIYLLITPVSGVIKKTDFILNSFRIMNTVLVTLIW